MRIFALLVLGSSILSSVGCTMLDPNNRFNVNRGEINDEYSVVRKEGRGTEVPEKENNDGLDNWLYSPTYRAINKNLGVD